MTAAITATPDLVNSPPRMQLAVSGMAGASVVTVSRVDADGTMTAVRTANPATLAAGSWVGFDYEAPFNVNVHYVANPDVGTNATSSTVKLDPDAPWLIHPGIPDLSVPLDMAPLGDRTRSTNQGVHQPLGRADAVVITDGVRRLPTFDLTCYTHTLLDYDAMGALIGDASVLLLQISYPNMGRTFYGWVSIGDTTDSDMSGYWHDYNVRWTLPCTSTSAPAGLLQSQWTLGDLAANFATLGDIKNTYATLGGIATNSPGT